jgi:demethylmenaquinone methyltransferase/2-methoxy-6-polyprenyl-1,4-benzoquinol methylase
MFDAIARRYDTLNHTLSAGMDRRWRRRAIRDLNLTGGERVLDVCTGTADLAIEAVTAPTGAAGAVVGVDFAGEMLKLGLAKLRRSGLTHRVQLVRGDATLLPLPDAAFDAVTIGFGIRNVVDPERACREFHRVTRAGGSLAVLEFGFPRIPGIRAAYRWYFRYLLPLVGRLVSRHGEAYSYLPASVERFPSPEAFAAALETAGFTSVRYVPLTLGVVYLYVARKAA